MKKIYAPVMDLTDANGNLPLVAFSYNDIKDIAMGATINSDSTVTFRFFSPKASGVDLVLYFASNTSYNDSGNSLKIAMTRNQFGIWQVTTDKASPNHNPGAQKYKYYRFRTKGLLEYQNKQPLSEAETYIPDIYARANVRADGHSIVIDPTSFTWSESPWPANKPSNSECIVYELHIKDFTAEANSGVANKGSYLGLKQKIPYLVSLGINCVELMPVHEFSTDSGGPILPQDPENYSWGYLPALFFAPESSYASSGNTGQQVDELKDLINELHKNGIKVILDIVLTHVSNTYNYLFLAEPEGRYYFKLESNGSWANAGTGNLIAADETRPFAKKIVIDNLRYWLLEYRIDGFRFDLAPATPYSTMISAYEEMKKIKADVFVTLENWWGNNRHNVTGSGMNMWNDFIRDATHSFILGQDNVHGSSVIARLKQSVYFSKGVQDIGFNRAISPMDTLNLLESHDEETVGRYAGSRAKTAIANALLLTAQGIPMLQMGQEFMRNKAKQDQDEADNVIYWNDLNSNADNQALKDFTAYLIKLRKDCPAFRMAQDPDTSVSSFINFFDYNGSPGDATSKGFGFHLNVGNQAVSCITSGNSTETSGANQFMVLFNLSAGSQNFPLPAGSWEPIAAIQGNVKANIFCKNASFGNCTNITWAAANNVFNLGTPQMAILKKL